MINWRIIFIISLSAILVTGCGSNSEQVTEGHSNSVNGNITRQNSETGDEKILNLIKALRAIDIKQADEAADQLRKTARENSENKRIINEYLLDETKKLCTTQDAGYHIDQMEGSKYSQLKYSSALLAEFQNTEALETLVDCSNHQDLVGGLKSWDYATMRPVISFKENAISILKEKLGNSSADVRCRISTVILIISDKEAEPILKQALKTEKDKTVIECLKFDINAIKNNK